MRCLLLLLLLSLLSFLAFVVFKRKSPRTAVPEREILWKREKTEKAPIKNKKLDQKGEPWIKVVKRAEHVRELCKEWGSERSFPLKQVIFMDEQ